MVTGRPELPKVPEKDLCGSLDSRCAALLYPILRLSSLSDSLFGKARLISHLHL